jgi:hypothetical protein
MQPAEAVEAISAAQSWDARIALIRKIPEGFGTAQHQGIYAAVAKSVYVPHLAPDFAYIHWRDDYELPSVEPAYRRAYELTSGFSNTTVATITAALRAEPSTLRVFRLILGFTTQEFAASTAIVAARANTKAVNNGRIKNIESGTAVDEDSAALCATVIDETIRGVLFGPSPTTEVRLKSEKPDTLQGWQTVQQYASNGVPLEVFLHQRHYGGAFRQLLDATSTKRGDLLEDAVEELFTDQRIPFIRTGSHNQEEIARRFGITVKPAPDFVVFDNGDVLRALLECKGANDGGTARDKAARFRSLRAESVRLGGVPLFAVLAGLGWQRTADALGPVVRDTDGRVFTLPTLREMLHAQPFPGLIGMLPA